MSLAHNEQALDRIEDPPRGEPAAIDSGEEAGRCCARAAAEPARAAPPQPGEKVVLKLGQLLDDTSFCLREQGDIDSLTTSIVTLGQLNPIDVRPAADGRYQVVTGFRRLAALRFLKREKVLARVHPDLSDADALRMALADLVEHRAVSRAELEALKARLQAEGRLAPVADALERALAPAGGELAPEMVEGADEEEVELDALAQDVLVRLAQVNQDLALVVELWSALEPSMRKALTEQLAYPEQLAAYLRGNP